ncbi:Equilibrative nucleotide transporter 2 [Acorus calamus]|uniref:Equilibrative nucleotide transporter 2 n=1 Tax=Acorus calamus TaxID=4465 RepID=A0AAV9DUU5_ACOCL|nr:Equilibrative nucleotide transporter 2 [Acorus calamus]
MESIACYLTAGELTEQHSYETWTSSKDYLPYWLPTEQNDLATSGRGGIGSYIGICIISGAFGVAYASRW